jgi:hypothetical protein
MTDILDELTEIPFEVFWAKWVEVKPGYYNRPKAEAIWFSMKESDRIDAFEYLAHEGLILDICHQPYLYLKRFRSE